MNGLAPLTLLVFSLGPDPEAWAIKSSSSLPYRFFPQMRHATIPRPAKRIAPPMPTTTPTIVFFAEELMPELPPLLLPESRLGAPEVAAADGVIATRADVVKTLE